MSKPKISIISPVYNAEPYIIKCLDSIMGQTFLEWECILVDDGSTDNSGGICDDYSKRDNRFKSFHKENGGVSSALQLCIDNAIGEYIIRIDPDDWVDSDMLTNLWSVADSRIDILIVDYYTECDGVQNLFEQEDVNNGDQLLLSILKGKSMGSLCNKLIRRSLYNGKCFPLDLFYCEDVYMLARIVLDDKCIIKNFHHAYYHYVQHPLSLTHRLSSHACENRWLYTEIMERLFMDCKWSHWQIILLERQRVVFNMIKSKHYSFMQLKKRIDAIPSPNTNSPYYMDYYKNRMKFYWFFLKYSSDNILNVGRKIKSLLR